MDRIVQEKIKKEVSEGRVLGPYLHLPLRTLRVSPLRVVPKKNQGEFRLIHHLPYPEGESVSDAISQELCTVCYTSFDVAMCMVHRCGQGDELAKCNIKSAFCILLVHSLDFYLLGFYFQGYYYIDRACQWDALSPALRLSGSVHFWNGNSDAEWVVEAPPII